MKPKNALKLAIASLDRVCRENYTVRAQAARFGFEYGIKAKQHFDEYQEAIKILQDMLDKLNGNDGQERF